MPRGDYKKENCDNSDNETAKRKDVDSIVNACDAGREGELIFRYIMEIGHIDKPVKRLWMQSMTNDSILFHLSASPPFRHLVTKIWKSLHVMSTAFPPLWNKLLPEL